MGCSISGMHRLVRVLLAGAALVVVLFTRTTPAAVRLTPSATYEAAADAWPLTAEPLSSPAGADSSAPQLTAEGNRAILSWMEREGPRATLKFAERTASGWSAARSVVSGTDLGQRGGRAVVRARGGTPVAQW